MFAMIMTRLKKLAHYTWIREGAPLLGLYWLYSSIRWFVARNSPYEAFENAFKVIQLETQLGIFHEPAIQKWLIENAMGIVRLANNFYTVGYFPILLLTGVLLYRFDPDRFHDFKLTFLLGLGFALVCFSVFPLAPPRMLPEAGFIDTQEIFGDGFYNHKTTLSFYNPYAAMPSLHFGWALLIAIMAIGSRRRVIKIMGALYPCCMALTIVITGHHYILDIVGGGVVVGLAYILVKAFPHITKEWMVNPGRLNSHVSYGQESTRPRPSRRSDPKAINQSENRLEHIKRHKRYTTFVAWLNNRRPPL
jgi:membrane-associated phospholipid phosphatase